MTQSFPYPELYCAGVLFSISVIGNWRRGINKRPKRVSDEPPDGGALFFSALEIERGVVAYQKEAGTVHEPL